MFWDNLDEDLQRQEIESVANAIRDSKFSIGEKVKVKYLRNGDEKSTSVKLSSREN